MFCGKQKTLYGISPKKRIGEWIEKNITLNNKSHFNPLTANDEISRLENSTFLWTWILRWVPWSFATHASLCNTLSSNKLCPKTVKILSVKWLKTYVYVRKITYLSLKKNSFDII